jgi:hypothetical protein
MIKKLKNTGYYCDLEIANKVITKLMNEKQKMIDRQNKHEECLTHGRCKDCAHFSQGINVNCLKISVKCPMETFITVLPDFYCAYFKRKDNG